MASSVVQSRSTVGSGDSLALAYTSNVAAGSLLVCVCATYGNTGTGEPAAASVSDSVNGTWTRVQADAESGDASAWGAIFYFANAGAGATTVTVNPTGSAADINFAIIEVSGVVTSSPVNANTTNDPGTGTAASSGSITPTGGGNYFVVAYLTHSGATTTISEPSGAWNKRYEDENAAGQMPLRVDDNISLAGGSSTSQSWTLGASRNYTAGIVAFTDAGAAASVRRSSLPLTGVG